MISIISSDQNSVSGHSSVLEESLLNVLDFCFKVLLKLKLHIWLCGQAFETLNLQPSGAARIFNISIISI